MLRDSVGGRPDTSGFEEARRRGPARRFGLTGLLRGERAASIVSVVSGRRIRLQVAGGAALLTILLLTLLLPSRTVRIAVDGGTVTVTSRTTSASALVRQAGIDLGPGDRVDRASAGELIVRRAVPVSIEIDGRVLSLRSQAGSVAELFAEAGITLDARDSVLRDGLFVSIDEPVAGQESVAALLGRETAPWSGTSRQPVLLEVRRAVPFTMIENGQRIAISSSRQTVATALRDAGVRLGPGDRVQPSLDTELTAGLQVHVEHATPVVVTLPDGKAVVYTLAGTVGDALAEARLALPADYRLEPAASTPIGAGLAVHVIGISQEQVLETERIESHTIYQPDPSLPWGEQRVVMGQDGVHYWQYEIVYENTEPVSRELAAEWYDPEPVDTVVYYSTAQPVAAAVVSSSASDWRGLVCSYDWDCDWALAVIACESGGNPNAYNPQGPYVGLFQIWVGHGDNLEDPTTNIAAAYSLYLSGGRGHWPNCP